MPQRLQIGALVRHEHKFAVFGGDWNDVAQPGAWTDEGVAAVVHAHPQRQPHADALPPPGAAMRTHARAGPRDAPATVSWTPDKARDRKRTALCFLFTSHACVASKGRAPSVS